MSGASRTPYILVFATLVVLTVAEIAVVYFPGISRAFLVSALVFLALGKAALVLLFFMHLAGETRALKLTVMLPFLLPATYAFSLIGEAAWRLRP